MANPRTALILSFAALSLASCAEEKGAYPSLARRPAEHPAPPAPLPAQAPSAIDAATLARLDSLVAQARAADAKFQGKQAQARDLVGAAKGAAMGSEAWSVATVALSDLESSRSDAFVAMAELDALYTQAVIGGISAGEIAAARNSVQGILTSESAVIDSLKSGLS